MHVEPRDALPKIMLARYYGGNLGRFLSVDPSNKSIHRGNPQSWNRYSYVLNNPLVFIDPTGMTLTATGTKKEEAEFKEAADSGLFGKEVKFDDSGGVTLESTGEEGPPTPEQMEMESVLQAAINQGNTTLNLSRNDQAAPIDDFHSKTLDTADVSRIGSGPGPSAAGMVAHAVAEQFVNQNRPGFGGDYSKSHGVGVTAENAVTGYTRTDTGRPLERNPQGNIHGRIEATYTRGNEVVNVTIRVRYGNVTKVDRQ